MSQSSVPFFGFEAIDWDEEDDPDGNLSHCLEHGIDEVVVDAVLRSGPVEIKMKLQTAEYSIVGKDRSGRFWTILFDSSYKRGDWLRPSPVGRQNRQRLVSGDAQRGFEHGRQEN